MSHSLQALIAKPEALQHIKTQHPIATIIPLTNSLSLFPLTDEVLDAIENLPTGQRKDTRFEDLSPNFKALLAEASHIAPVACVFTEYFGGQGVQGALVFEKSSCVFGPLVEANSINRALNLLGVIREKEKDEFDTVGLGRHRSNEKWIASIK